MKTTICIVFMTLMCSQIFAQRWNGDHRDETLFSRSNRAGFFVSPLVEYSDFKNELTTSVGGGFGFIAGDLFIGAYGLGVTDYDNLLDDGFRQLDMGHGGFWLGYVFPQRSAIHLFTSVKAGWGAVDIEFDDDDFDYRDAFFAVTPEAGVEVSIFRWFRVAGTVGYRFMNGLEDAPNFDKDELQTMTGTLTFRIGGFGRERNKGKWQD